MNLNYLDFEQPIAELEEKIDALESIKDDADIAKEMESLKTKSELLTKKIFSSLTDWQISQLARHPQRLYTLDYIENIFDEFTELCGDRAYANDHSLIGGIAKIDDLTFMFLGQQKGRSTKEKIYHNFGMTRPECFGNEAVFDGEELSGIITSGAYGYRVGHSVAFAYLNPRHCNEGKALRVETSLGSRKCHVSMNASYDNDNEKLRS